MEKSLIEKLKSRWGIESTWQVFIICIVFACTGFSSLFARRFVFDLLGIIDSDPFWLKSLVWVVTILPIYNVLLLMYGALFGQFDFFWNFFKKMIGRFAPGSSS